MMLSIGVGLAARRIMARPMQRSFVTARFIPIMLVLIQSFCLLIRGLTSYQAINCQERWAKCSGSAFASDG